LENDQFENEKLEKRGNYLQIFKSSFFQIDFGKFTETLPLFKVLVLLTKLFNFAL